MTEYRTSASTRNRRPLECALVGFGIIALALLAIGVATGHAVAASPEQPRAISGQDEPVPDEPPENATYSVEITPRAPDDARVDVTIRYVARSSAELERARNETLTAEWFRGEEIVRDAMAARGLSDDAVEHPRTTYSVPRGDDAETVTIRYRVQWTDIPPADDDRVRLGPGFAAALEPGDEFRVAVPDERWGNTTANRDRDALTHSQRIYAWTIGDEPAPEIELYRGDVGAENDGDGDGALGLPLAVPLLALLLAGGALAHRRRS